MTGENLTYLLLFLIFILSTGYMKVKKLEWFDDCSATSVILSILSIVSALISIVILAAFLKTNWNNNLF